MTGVWEVAATVIATFGAAVAIIVVAVGKVARLRAAHPESPAAVTARLEALERGVEGVQGELADIQERLDFTERLLSKAPEERRIGD
jgi:hypothetical protein